MIRIQLTDRAGETYEIKAEPGVTLMEAIKAHGVDDMLALCGGCCSCATCHVRLDPTDHGYFPPLNEDEEELLDSSGYRDARSRLSCQLALTPEIEWLRVTLVPED